MHNTIKALKGTKDNKCQNLNLIYSKKFFKAVELLLEQITYVKYNPRN